MSPSSKMPVLFVGHGSPGNAFEKNEYSAGWGRIARDMPKPEAILCVSAHWVTSTHWVSSGTAVTAAERLRTIHDFYGFPEEYYRLEYPAKGSPAFAERVKTAVKTVPVEYEHERGLDHGAWSVLVNMYPQADIPVLQLSIDGDLPLEKHAAVGADLAKLRDEGLLIIGSGNVVHNLMLIDPDAPPYPWALGFDGFVKDALERKDIPALVRYTEHPSAAQALPTNEHYLPLLYAAGAAGAGHPRFFNESIFAASVSMRCVIFE